MLSALNDVVDICVINGLIVDEALDSSVTDADGVNLNSNGNVMLILLLLFAVRFPIIIAVLPNLTYLYLQYWLFPVSSSDHFLFNSVRAEKQYVSYWNTLGMLEWKQKGVLKGEGATD